MALALLLAAITRGVVGLVLIAADATERAHRKWQHGCFSRAPRGVLAPVENCRIFARDRWGCICPSRISIRLPTWPSEFSFQSQCVPMHRTTRLTRPRQRMRDVLH